MENLKVGLALSGGGARGFAHIGVLKVLEKANIPIDVISGTSMGGIICAAYAAGMPISEIESLALKLSNVRELFKLLDPTPARRGILEGTRVKKYLLNIFGEESTFEKLKIPTALCAVDLITAKEITLKSGPLLPAILATIAFPGIFSPVPLNNFRLVDGGVLNNLPVEQARELGAQILIAVDVQGIEQSAEPMDTTDEKQVWPIPLPDFFKDFYRSELIMVSQLTRYKLRDAKPEILIHPPIAPEIDMFIGFTRAKEIIYAGEQAAELALDGIEALLFQG